MEDQLTPGTKVSIHSDDGDFVQVWRPYTYDADEEPYYSTWIPDGTIGTVIGRDPEDRRYIFVHIVYEQKGEIRVKEVNLSI